MNREQATAKLTTLGIDPAPLLAALRAGVPVLRILLHLATLLPEPEPKPKPKRKRKTTKPKEGAN